MCSIYMYDKQNYPCLVTYLTPAGYNNRYYLVYMTSLHGANPKSFCGVSGLSQVFSRKPVFVRPVCFCKQTCIHDDAA